MKSSVEYFHDRSQWGSGPWDHEPDKIQWRDEATGLPCLMVRNHMGNWCGYVGVGPDHPFYQKGYGDVDVQVHGGLTYADKCNGPICHKVEEGEEDNVWWFGFDCAHGGDLVPSMLMTEKVLREKHPDEDCWKHSMFKDAVYRDQHYVKQEVEYLAEQLKQVQEKAA